MVPLWPLAVHGISLDLSFLSCKEGMWGGLCGAGAGPPASVSVGHPWPHRVAGGHSLGLPVRQAWCPSQVHLRLLRILAETLSGIINHPQLSSLAPNENSERQLPLPFLTLRPKEIVSSGQVAG